MQPQRKIAVLGGTGKAGKYLTGELINQGFQVKALARNSEKLIQKSSLLEVIQGNARNYENIYNTLQGCDAVISALGPSKSEPDTCSIATAHVIKAMYELKIKRYILLAGLGIDTPGDHKSFFTRFLVSVLKLFFSKVINDRQKDYQLLADSDLDWTIVRSSMIELTNEKRELKISLLDTPGRKVSSTDLALFMISQLNDSQFIGKAPFVAG